MRTSYYSLCICGIHPRPHRRSSTPVTDFSPCHSLPREPVKFARTCRAILFPHGVSRDLEFRVTTFLCGLEQALDGRHGFRAKTFDLPSRGLVLWWRYGAPITISPASDFDLVDRTPHLSDILSH
jgi:hypothetical protein